MWNMIQYNKKATSMVLFLIFTLRLRPTPVLDYLSQEIIYIFIELGTTKATSSIGMRKIIFYSKIEFKMLLPELVAIMNDCLNSFPTFIFRIFNFIFAEIDLL